MPANRCKPLLTLLLWGSIQGSLIAQISSGFTYTIDCDRTVHFTNTSTGFTTVAWNFGDSNSSGATNPAHQYTASGIFSVTLNVSNGVSSASSSQSITLYDPPSQSIAGSLSVCENAQEAYTASTSGNNYQWTVTGGTILSGQGTNSITVLWVQTGSGTVQLTERNAIGCSAATSVSVITHPLPKPDINIAADQTTGTLNQRNSACLYDEVTYHLAPPLNSGSTYQWQTTGGNIAGSSQADSVLVYWNTLGGGLIEVTETTSFGCSATDRALIQVNPIPHANFSAYDICLGSAVDFTDLSTGNFSSWHWDFGDGSNSSEQNPSHVYSGSGTYNVTLTVSPNDSLFPSNYEDGCPDDTTIAITVAQNPGPEISCPGTVCPGDAETYSTPPVAGATYNWIVTGGTITSGGGTSDNTVTVDWGNGPVGTVSLQITGAGSYCNLPTVVQIPIVSPNLQISGPSTICRFSNVTFGAPLLPGSTYNWTVTGGSITAGQGTNSITTYFSSAGAATVSLNVFHDLTNCSGQDVLTANVLDKFYLSASTSACAQSTQTYSVIGTPSPAGYTWNWNVTGGTIVSGQGTGSISVQWGNGPIGEVTVNAPAGIYCNSQEKVSVSIKPLPAPAALSGALNVCAASTVTYFVPAGYYSTWTVTGGTVTSGGTAGSNYVTVQWNAAGSGQITVAQEDRPSWPYCSTTTNFAVNISGNTPVSVSGPTPVCAGHIATYTVGSNPAIPYLWEVTGGTILSGFGTNSITVQWGAGPWGTVAITELACNNSDNLVVAITGTNAPVIDTSNLTCTGSSVTLVVPGDYVSYTWSTGSTDTFTNINAAGTYSVSVTDANGCTAEASISLSSLPTLPIPVAAITGAGPPMTPVVVLELTAHPDVPQYQWSTGSANQSIYVSVAGTYFVTVTNEYGCTANTSVVVINQGPGLGGGGGSVPGAGGGGCPTVNPDFTFSNCNPIQFTNTTAPAALGYFWDFGDGAYSWAANPSHAFNALGNYNVRLYGTDDGVCWNVIQHSVTITSVLNPSFTFSQGCFGQPIQFTDASTSALPITSWQWDFGDGNNSASQNPTHIYSSAGSFIITLTISDGICNASFNDTIIIQNLSASFTYQQACLGTPALFTDNSAGALQIVRWDWDLGDGNSSSVQHASHQYISAGNYNVMLTVTDAAGCTASTTIVVSVSQFIAGNITYSGVTTFCEGGNLGLNAPAGAGYSYLWSTGETTASINANQSGAYYVVVTNAAGCKDTTGPVVIQIYPKPQAYITANGPVTFCDFAHYVTLVANPSGPGFTYQWTKNGVNLVTTQTTNISASIQSGTYTVIVTDNHGCKDTSAALPVTIFPNPPYPTIANTGPTTFCQGDSVILTAPAGYQYNWDNGATSQSTAVYSSGWHTVTIIDTNGCSSTGGITINVRALPDMRLAAYGCYDVCISDSNRIYGPPGMSSYSWSTGETTQSVLVDEAGVYSLTATSSSGCMDSSDNLYISTTNFLGIDLGNDTSFCEGGSVTFDAGSGFSAYTWQNGSTSQTFIADTTGNYFVQATDSSGCFGSDTVALLVFPNPVVNLNDTSVCSSTNLTLDAGSGFTTYLWNDSSANQTLSVSLSGSYSVTVTDLNNCTASDAVSVSFSSATTSVSIGNDVALCDGASVTLNAGGGFVSYTWQDGSTGQTYTTDTSEVITVVVVDSSGCLGVDTVVVTVFPNPVVNIIDSFDCFSETVTLYAWGSGGINSYFWSDSSSNQTLIVSTSGIYSVTVTDANGCTASNAIIVSLSFAASSIDLGGDVNLCDGTSVTFDAGSGFVTYVWHDGSTGQTYTTDTSEYITIQVIDSSGCWEIDTVIVTVFANPVVTLQDTSACVATIVLDADSGYASYLWSDSSTNQSLAVTTSGTYSVTVFDANGCTGTNAATVNLTSTFTITAEPDTAICSGDTVQLNVTGGNSYTWNPAATLINPNSSNPLASPTSTTVYVVVAFDSSGCSNSDSVIINVLPLLTAQATPDTSLCAGSSTQLSASGGTMYSWFPSTGLSCAACPNPVANPQQTISYSVEVSQPGYCNNDTAYVTVNILPSPDAGLDSVITISAGGQVTLAPNGGMSGYEWSATNGWTCSDCPSPTISPTETTIYTLVVTDSAGCASAKQIVVRVLNDCEGKFYIPTAFSPNDDGHNDIFRIIHPGDLNLIDFKVFNRWGEVVFETEDPSKGWDGIYKGVPQDLAVFAYYARMTCGQEIQTIIGNVTLVH